MYSVQLLMCMTMQSDQERVNLLLPGIHMMMQSDGERVSLTAAWIILMQSVVERVNLSLHGVR